MIVMWKVFQPSSLSTSRTMRSDDCADSHSVDPEDIYGVLLLQHLSSEIHSQNLPKLVIPIVMLTGFDRDSASQTLTTPSLDGTQTSDTVRMVRYLDAGAVDVIASPLSKDNVHGLGVHAYRTFKEVTREDSKFLARKRNRKISWVGVEEAKPYGYLREAMVSNLMGGICNPESVGEAHDPRYVSFDYLLEHSALLPDLLQPQSFIPRQHPSQCFDCGPRHVLQECCTSSFAVCQNTFSMSSIMRDTLLTFARREIDLAPERQRLIAEAIGKWSFSAHVFTDDELLHGALLMLQHALQMPELEKWRMSTGMVQTTESVEVITNCKQRSLPSSYSQVELPTTTLFSTTTFGTFPMSSRPPSSSLFKSVHCLHILKARPFNQGHSRRSRPF